MRNGYLHMVLAAFLLFTPSVAYARPLNPGPFSVRAPGVARSGRLNFNRLHAVTLRLSRSSRHPDKIVGRVNEPRGTISNLSRRRQVYRKANVGGALFTFEVRFRRSVYRVGSRGACTIWAIGDPK